MTTEEKILLTVLTITALLLALGAALGWPTWLWLLLAIPLFGVLGRMAVNIQRRVQLERLSQPYVARPVQVEQPDQSPHTPVIDVALLSAEAGCYFYFSATAYWRPTRGSSMQHANLSYLARNVILDRAQKITEVALPDQIDVVQHRLASALGTVQRDTLSGMEVWADQVQLTLPEGDRERRRKFSEMRKDEDLWEYERDYESRKRAYFRSEVLESTGSAVIWWLAHKDNDVEDTVRLIGALAQLSAAANNTEVSEPFRHLVPNGFCHDGSRQTTGFPWTSLPAGQFSDITPVVSHAVALIDTVDGDEKRALFAHHLAHLVETTGKPDEAQEIRRHRDAPATDKEPVDLSEPDGDLPDRPAPDVEPSRQDEPRRDSPLPGEADLDGQSKADEQLRSEQLDEPRD